MPDQDTDVELPVEDAVEQELLVTPEGEGSIPLDTETAGAESRSLEANEADYAEQQSVVGYDDEDYR